MRLSHSTQNPRNQEQTQLPSSSQSPRTIWADGAIVKAGKPRQEQIWHDHNNLESHTPVVLDTDGIQEYDGEESYT